MTNIANLPNIRPSLLLDFANSGRIDPRISCLRPTTATFVNSKGFIENAAANVPRIEYSSTGKCLGLLVEGAGANLLLASENFSAASWSMSGAVVSQGASTSPSGGANTSLITQSAGGYVYTSVTYTSTVGGYITASIYTDTPQRILNFGGASPSGTDKFTVYPLRAGWYRQVLVRTFMEAVTRGVQVLLALGASAAIFQVWGAQLEAGGIVSSYIPTLSAAVSRAPDLVQMLGANFSSWYRPDCGTFVMRSSRMNLAGTVLALASASTNSRMGVYGTGTSIQLILDGVTQVQAGMFGALTEPGVADCNALAMAKDDFAFAKNGGAVGVDTSGSVASAAYPFTGLHIGSAAWATTGADFLYGYVERIAYYPARLANTELQALSTL